MKTWKVATALEVRQLPVGSKVQVRGKDRRQIPYIIDAEVVKKRNGDGKELRYSTYNGFERMTIREDKRWFYVEVDED